MVFGKKLQTFAAKVLGVEPPEIYAPSKKVTHDGRGLTAVEKIFNRNIIDGNLKDVLYAGSDVE